MYCCNAGIVFLNKLKIIFFDNIWAIHGNSCSKNIRVYSCIFMCILLVASLCKSGRAERVFKKNTIVFLNILDKRRLVFFRVLARGKGLLDPKKGIMKG